MVSYMLFVPLIASFLITFLSMPYWIKKAKEIKLVWPDMNKYSKDKVIGSGGVVFVLGFVIGVLLFVAYRVFILNSEAFLIESLVILTSVLFLAGVGFTDDIFGWQKGGLRRRTRIVLIAMAAIPLMAVNAGRSDINIPLYGVVDLGILYPLILIPLGIVGATTTYNFLAGFNGLEAGQGVLLLSAVAVVAFFTGNSWLAIINLVAVAGLLAFLFYNKFPAKVFPGDSLTYVVGGMIAISAIVGNFEKIAVFFFIPYILEFFLKAKGKFDKYSFGKPNKNGTLGLRYKEIYSLNHLTIVVLQKLGIAATEKNATRALWLFQLIILLLGFLLFKNGIF